MFRFGHSQYNPDGSTSLMCWVERVVEVWPVVVVVAVLAVGGIVLCHLPRKAKKRPDNVTEPTW